MDRKKSGSGLVVSRKAQERVIVYVDGEQVAEVRVDSIRSREVRLGFKGDRNRVIFLREELVEPPVAGSGT